MNICESGTRIKIAIVQPHAIFRCGVRTTLRSLVRNAVFLELEDPSQASRHFERYGFAEALFLDFPARAFKKGNKWKRSNMIQLFRKVSSIIVLPTIEPNMANAAKRLGARGAIAADSPIDEIVDACHEVFRHKTKKKEKPSLDGKTIPRRSLVANRYCAGIALTPRQLEVFQYLVEGRTNAEIGNGLGISLHTAKIHVSAVLKALGVPTRARACAMGRELLAIPSGERR